MSRGYAPVPINGGDSAPPSLLSQTSSGGGSGGCRVSWKLLAALGAVAIALAIFFAVTATQTDWYTSSSSSSASTLALPLVKPPVVLAVPSGLNGAAAAAASLRRVRAHLASFDATAVKDRFFSPTGGPTQLFGLLDAVDGRITGINQRADQFAACLARTANVSHEIPVWSQNATLWMQCGESWGTGFLYFARVNDTFYLFENGGETRMLAHVHLAANTSATNVTTDAVERVELWYSVGLINTNGSHAVVHLVARPAEQVFEMVAAGAGIGFCGAQLRAANGTMNVTGSADGPDCDEVASVCTAANDTTVSATCSAESSAFELVPLGTLAYGSRNASQYPGGDANNVNLTVNGTDDDTHFGFETYTEP